MGTADIVPPYRGPAHTTYSKFSPEELRVNDYNLGFESSNQRGNLFAALLNKSTFPRCALPESDSTRGRPMLGNTTITFKVGLDTPRDFEIHEALVTHSSDFVRNALKKNWKESKDRVISLPDAEPAVFELYQDWLFDRKVYITTNSIEYERLIKAYIFGEKLLDRGFKTAILCAITRVLRATVLFDITLTNSVYENMPAASPLRKLFRDVYVSLGSPSWLDGDETQEINPDFLWVVNRELMGLRRQSPDAASLPFGTDANVAKNYVEDEAAG